MNSFRESRRFLKLGNYELYEITKFMNFSQVEGTTVANYRMINLKYVNLSENGFM